MSYILDALKKAERERSMAQVPTLTTVHDLRSLPRIRLWAASVVVLLGIAAAIWFFLPSLRTQNKGTPALTSEPDRAANKSEAERIGESTSYDAIASSPASSESPEVLKPGPARESLPHGENGGYASATASPMEAKIASPTTAARRPASAEHLLGSSTQTALTPRTNINEPGIPPQEKMELARTQPVVGEDSLEKAMQPPAAAEAKPLPLQEAMAKMKMTILLFSENKADRLVFINGKKYVEGDRVEGNYLLESITQEGAVLSYNGERAVLRPGSK